MSDAAQPEQASARAAAIVGFWLTEGGEAVFEIRPEGATFTGRLAWLRDPEYPPDDPLGMAGQALVDRHNPDPALRARPLAGLQLLAGLTYRHDRQGEIWREGRIYNSDNGKHYRCHVWLADADHLKLRGYIGRPILGRTTTWTRVADPARRPPA